ncbi:MAG: GNAT family N-acetyltransferase [Candidatus Promineifilaceae bacterium]
MFKQHDFTQPVEILTERLRIRTPLLEDVVAVKDAMTRSLPQLKPWMIWAQEPPTIKGISKNIEGAIVKYEAAKDCRLHLFLREDNTFIGSSGIHFRDLTVPSFEIGYWIDTPYYGNGYVTEAVHGITKFALEQFGAKRIMIQADDRNVASWRVAERAGYKLEGILRNESRNTSNRLTDKRIYAWIA